MDKILSLSKRRGFIFPNSEIYGGFANAWDYGPLGAELKNNIKKEWWKIFVHQREDMLGLDSAIIMNPKVWEASGHIKNFTDPLVECKNCHNRFRPDKLKTKNCPSCGAKNNFTEPRQFNCLFKTFVGPAEEKSNTAYLRPETAQGMFVDFKNILDTSRKQIPFGIAQLGKAFRNEITPGNFIFRSREFEQMEIEYFIKPPKTDKEWQKHFDYWLEQMKKWIERIGINLKKIEPFDVPEKERAHYSKKTIDILYEFPFGKDELYGLAYRTGYDLKSHMEKSGEDLRYTDPNTKEKYIPHVIEPSFGVDRSVLAAMLEAYHEEDAPTADPPAGGGGIEKRIVMKFPFWLAPIKAAVLPLVKNKKPLVDLAKKIYRELKTSIDGLVDFDETGSIGRRYRRQDEAGTPVCITVDFESLENKDATIRDRDTMKQERIKIEELSKYILNKS